MLIRKVERSDAEAVLGLVSDLLSELGGQPLPSRGYDAYAELMASPARGFVLLAEADAAPVAVCTVSHVHALRSVGPYSIIQEMYVRPDCRSTKIGSKLLDRALEEAESSGSAFVELGTPVGGERQIAFYEGAGFAIVGERLRWIPPR